ncbi:MAG: oxidoreductase [Microbacteriaceae bacterium]|nr:oxidoreductase [Microbacteriaceae bacterium]
MRVFVTGASGWIGSAVVADLLEAGHEVVGLARSDESAARITAAGAEPHRGSLDDLESLRTAAEASDGVIHLGFRHDFSDMAGAGRTERAAVGAIGDALVGSDRPLVLASGVAGLAMGRVATELDRPAVTGPDAPRGGSEDFALSFADRGVRPVSVRFAPTVHGDGDHGFIATLVGVAREKDAAGYVGDGESRWPAVARVDAARLVRLGFEKAPAASVLHAVGEQGIQTRVIADAIARGLNVPAVSIAQDDVMEHFGWIGMFFGMDIPASSIATQQLLGWNPTGPTLLEDLDAGYYFRTS